MTKNQTVVLSGFVGVFGLFAVSFLNGSAGLEAIDIVL